MKIALAQLQLSAEMDRNFQKALSCMEEAARNRAELICFPELQFSPFFPQYPAQAVTQYAMALNDPKVLKLQEKSKQTGLVSVLNFYLEEHAKYYDASPVIDTTGRLLGVSKMVHIVQVPGFYEQDYYTPSDTGFQVYDTGIAKVGVVVCFDRHYPESIRACALQGAEIIIIPTANVKGEPLELFEWEVRVPAMQNNVFIAMCNRVGHEGEMDFCGQSLVVDPDGNVVAKADDQEQMLYVDIDLERVKRSREQRPFLKLRRAEAYQDICHSSQTA